MAQAFVSTYKNHYRWNCQPRVQPCDPNKLSTLEPEGDIWHLDLNGEVEEELSNLPKIKEAIYRLYLKRMKTTYQVSYCENLKSVKARSEFDLKATGDQATSTDKKDSEDDLEDALLVYCRKLYGRKSVKIIPPLNSARNLFGYIRPTRLLTPLTMYQNQYGRVGYNVLEAGLKKHNLS